jgi:hypothetical protein
MPSRRRWMLVTIAGLAVTLTGPLSASPATAAVAKTCDKLTGKDLVKSPAIKVVFRIEKRARPGFTPFSGRVFYGCATPRGRVREIGRRGYEGYNDGLGANLNFALVKDAGTFLIVREESVDVSGAGSESYWRSVIDLRTGRSRTLWSLLTAEGGDCQEASKIGDPKQFVLGRNGIVAGVYVPGSCGEDGGRTRIVVSVPGKSLKVYDSGAPKDIPAASLKLSGRTVSWIKAGVRRSKIA